MEHSNAVYSQPDATGLGNREELENGSSALPFPPAHIAFLNHHLDLALQIWAAQPHDLDLLGRPLTFLVVESGNLEMLRAVAAQNYTAIRAPIRDAGDLSLLVFAVICDDEKIFSWLVEAECTTSDSQRLLRLAVTKGNSVIVGWIIYQPGMGLHPPWTNLIKLAINHKHADVVRAFPPEFHFGNLHSEEVLDQLADCAQEQGLDSLAAELRGIEPVLPTVANGLASLDAIQPQHYNMLAQRSQFPPAQFELHYPPTTSTMDYNSTVGYMQPLPVYQPNTNSVHSQMAPSSLYLQPDTLPHGAPNLWHAYRVPPCEGH